MGFQKFSPAPMGWGNNTLTTRFNMPS